MTSASRRVEPPHCLSGQFVEFPITKQIPEPITGCTTFAVVRNFGKRGMIAKRS